MGLPIEIGTLQRLCFIRLVDEVDSLPNDFSAPVPVEIQARLGGWVAGFCLLRFNDDGTVRVKSDRTGVIRDLPQNAWRDLAPLSR